MEGSLLVALKAKAYTACQQFAHTRIRAIQEAMVSAQASADEETKSSAGDKYETGRAMMQLELEKLNSQLQDALQLQQVINQIPPEQHSPTCRLGSVVVTDQGIFYISISAGGLTIDEHKVFAISPQSPMGLCLLNQSAGHQFPFQGKSFTVQQVL